jgi:hypothetical protein
MAATIQGQLPQSPLYKKAQEIFVLSRSISQYFVHDLATLQNDGRENPHIYFSGDIVQQSESLVPEILKAERHKLSDAKYRHAATVAKLTNLLYKNCERLEHSTSNGKEFLGVLRNELKKFRKLQRNWMLTL